MPPKKTTFTPKRNVLAVNTPQRDKPGGEEPQYISKHLLRLPGVYVLSIGASEGADMRWNTETNRREPTGGPNKGQISNWLHDVHWGNYLVDMLADDTFSKCKSKEEMAQAVFDIFCKAMNKAVEAGDTTVIAGSRFSFVTRRRPRRPRDEHSKRHYAWDLQDEIQECVDAVNRALIERDGDPTAPQPVQEVSVEDDTPVL